MEVSIYKTWLSGGELGFSVAIIDSKRADSNKPVDIELICKTKEKAEALKRAIVENISIVNID